MPLLFDHTFIKQDGSEVKGADALQGKVIALYFSAHWCPPCRGFTPKLKEFYEQAKNMGLEIIFVTSDRDEASMKEYFAEHGSYLALKFGDDLIKVLKENCGVRGIPTLAIVDPDGKLLHSDGRGDVGAGVETAMSKWKDVSNK